MNINIHIDMNIDIHIIMNMNIEYYISYYLLSIIYSLLAIPYWILPIFSMLLYFCCILLYVGTICATAKVGSAGSSGSSRAPLDSSTALTAQFRPPPRRSRVVAIVNPIGK